MMTDSEMRRLAHYIVMEQASNEQWLTAYAKAQSKLREPQRRLVSAKEAANMLGISVWLLYRIKDDEDGKPQFSYTKGNAQSSPLKFNSATLIEEYERYLAKQQKVVDIKAPLLKVM